MTSTGPTSSARATVMIVDDSPENLSMLAAILQGEYRVRAATSGKKALELIESEPPDLILLDVMMPDMDGFAACAQLKANPARSDIPVIFLSALTEVLDKVKAFQVGGVDYVTKPFQVDELLARVKTHCTLRRQSRELAEGYSQLRALEAMRDGLVHMIIHDLRTPLGAIYAMLDMLEEDCAALLPPDSAEDVRHAQHSAKKMMLLINSLLDSSKLEAGQMTLRCAPIDVNEAVEEVILSMRRLAGDAQIAFRRELDAPKVVADRELVSRVFQNLLANALKFAPAGSVVAVATELRGPRIRISVHDDGAGVPEAFVDKVFEKFTQVEAKAQRVASTGLGLHFCKLAVEAHGGAIGVDRTTGWNTFWFELAVGGPPSRADLAPAGTLPGGA